MARPQLPGLQSQPLGRPGREVLHEDIRLRRQALHDRASLAGLQVDGDRLLAPVEPDEVRAGAVDHVVVAAREIASVDPLHLDHPGAEVRQVPGRQRGGHGLFDRHDGDAVQREAHAGFSRVAIAIGLLRSTSASRGEASTTCRELCPAGLMTIRAVRWRR
jgi:hypothetical protein